MKVLNLLKRYSAVITLIFLIVQLFAFVGLINLLHSDTKNTYRLISNAYQLNSLDTAMKSLDSSQDMPMKLLGFKDGAELDAAYKEMKSEINNSKNNIQNNRWLTIVLLLLILLANAIAGKYVIIEIVSKRKLQSMS